MNQRHLAEIATRLARVGPDQRSADLRRRLAAEPRCPVARYLLACECFDRGRPALAVRHLMVAHHSEPRLQSAALLVFAGLNWIARWGTPLLPVLLDTWEEFRRPAFDVTAFERRLLDAFHEPDPGLAEAAPLAQRLWRLPIRRLRAEIEAALASRDANVCAHLTAPA